MLPDDISSDGRPPERELYDRLMRNKLVMPSHSQQSVPSCHDMLTPCSCASPARNWSRELFSCSLHEVARRAMEIACRISYGALDLQGAQPDGEIRTLLRWLKLTSSTMMLLEASSSDGRSPENELYDRLRCCRLVRLPRDGERRPSRPLNAREISVTAPLPLPPQVMPSHLQQFEPLRQDAARPLSCESPARNWRREPFSCSVHELAGEAKERSNRGTRVTRLKKAMNPSFCFCLSEQCNISALHVN
ncbi:hypothetical protein QOZ80_2AG0102010 [Eleusine coracana subsp. coracana]|nr:hypothetical protein QOZ80_2AG0102010 [Eleusine coracana subsp. coracana]